MTRLYFDFLLGGVVLFRFCVVVAAAAAAAAVAAAAMEFDVKLPPNAPAEDKEPREAKDPRLLMEDDKEDVKFFEGVVPVPAVAIPYIH